MRSLLASLFVLVLTAPAHALDVKEVKTDSGITAYLAEEHAVPVIAVSFAFRGGAAYDPAGKEGLAYLASGTLDEGAGPYDSQEFQERLADYAIELRFSSDQDLLSGSLRTVSDNAEVAFEMLKYALTAPRFDDEPVARVKRQIAVILEREQERPGTMASKAMAQAVFGDHPYARPSRGTAESVSALTSDDLKAYAQRTLTRERLLIGVAGDITADRLETMLDDVFGSLPETSGQTPLEPAELNLSGGVTVVDMPVPQASAVMVQRGLDREDPDWYSFFVVNHILGGGGFSGRLMQEVRVKRGLTYGIYTRPEPNDFGALLSGSVATQNARMGETVDVTMEVWRDLAENGPTREELELAKQYLTGSWPLRFTSSGRIASTLVAVQRDNLGLDFIDRRNDYIEAVSLRDARKIAREVLLPDSVTWFIAGQPEGVEAESGS